MRLDELQPGDLMVWDDWSPDGGEWWLYLSSKPFTFGKFTRLEIYGYGLSAMSCELIMTGSGKSHLACRVYRNGCLLNPS